MVDHVDLLDLQVDLVDQVTEDCLEVLEVPEDLDNLDCQDHLVDREKLENLDFQDFKVSQEILVHKDPRDGLDFRVGKVPEVLREIQVFLVAQVVLASLDQMEDLVPLDLTVAMASQDQGDLLEHQEDREVQVVRVVQVIEDSVVLPVYKEDVVSEDLMELQEAQVVQALLVNVVPMVHLVVLVDLVQEAHKVSQEREDPLACLDPPAQREDLVV